jgi:hypothetical protein
LSTLDRLKILHLVYLSKPTADRVVYQAVRRFRPRKIAEVGLGTAVRSLRMLALACQFHPAGEVHFTGMDRFEDRPAGQGPGITLREAHRALRATGAKVQLVPGNPCEGLSRAANGMGKLDLLVLAPGADGEDLAGAWFYVPRLLDEHSLVFLQAPGPDGEPTIRLVEHGEIARLAQSVRRAA